MSSAAPAISVVLPVYNAGRHLRAAVQSILRQSWRDFELIAVNDGSTDGSGAELESFAASDSRVRVISRPNTGIVGALNDGVAAARGAFIARMDADDWSVPSRLENQLTFLRAHPECVALGSAVIFMDAESQPVEFCPRELAHERLEQALLHGDGGALIHPSVMLRTDAIQRAGGYRREYQHLEDCDLFLRLARFGRLANLPEPLLYYRVHASSINFLRNEGRQELLQRMLAEAHAERGLAFDPGALPVWPMVWHDMAARSRNWAATALHFGARRVAVKHALRACRLEPGNRSSWSALRYALGGSLQNRPVEMHALPHPWPRP